MIRLFAELSGHYRADRHPVIEQASNALAALLN
jgi:hypothetical protein